MANNSIDTESKKFLNDSLPFGNTKLYLAIASIVLAPIVGFVLSCISIYLADKDSKMYKLVPDNYNSKALSQHKTGLILSWVGFVVSILFSAIILYYFYEFGTLNIDRINELKAAQ